MTFEKNVLQGYREVEASESVGLGDGCTVAALGVGKVKSRSLLSYTMVRKLVAG